MGTADVGVETLAWSGGALRVRVRGGTRPAAVYGWRRRRDPSWRIRAIDVVSLVSDMI